MDSTTRRLMMGAAGAVSPAYIEDVFSTWLYTGTGATQTITNGIDLAGKGGLVWTKFRSGSYGTEQHAWIDTARGVNKYIMSDSTAAENTSYSNILTAFNADGYSLGADSSGKVNGSSQNYASWTFRKAAKFFDVVTYTGDGATNLEVSHNLGSVPGAIIVKCTSAASTSWKVYHRSLGRNTDISLNTTEAATTVTNFWGTSDPTATKFYVGSAGAASLNGNGQTYIAYLFAHDAGGFGDSGNESVIKCGSYTGNGSTSGPVIDLGWEPQWLLIKRATGGTDNWIILDTMRGMSLTNGARLTANSAGAEVLNGAAYLNPLSTGFQPVTVGTTLNNNGDTYIYIAIRRGPMKTPTDATKVFSTTTAATSGSYVQTGWPPDSALYSYQLSGFSSRDWASRLTGNDQYLVTHSTNGEATYSTSSTWNSRQLGYENTYAQSAYDPLIQYLFRRAPGFFDVVAYTGTGANRTVSHNLGVTPELLIVKRRNATGAWQVYLASLSNTEYLVLNTTAAKATSTARWNSTTATSSVFSLGTDATVNDTGGTYIAYLFATLTGVSKVGSYTGTGTTLSIDCGFTNGARFVLIKRTNSTGDWYIWDTARGIVSGNDPYLLLNDNGPQVTNTDYIDPLSSGFQISSTAPAAINANGGNFIFLAVA